MPKPHKSVAAIRKVALALPEAEEGTSCNKLAFKAGKNGFLYVGEDEDGGFNVKLKLTGSLDEARKLARQNPAIYTAGSNGWVDAEFPAGKAPPKGLVERWIEESYRSLVPKKLVARLDERS